MTHVPKLTATERSGRAPSVSQALGSQADVVPQGSSSEGAMLKETARTHKPEKPQLKEPQPLIDNFLIVYWSVVIIASIASWFVLKAQHVDAKALAEAGSYHESAGASAWKWHAMTRKTTANQLGQIEFTASGAGSINREPLTNCNGPYEWAGQHNGRTKYANKHDAIVFFDGEWKMNHCDDTSTCCFISGVSSGWEPPYKVWTTAFEDGESVLLEDGKLETTHLPENMWSLCLVAALGQAKLPNSNKKSEVLLRPGVVAVICVFMALIQVGALFLIIHDIDPNSDTITTEPSTPYGSPASVNSIKVIFTLLLAIALVSEAGQVKATFQVGLEVYSCRLRTSRWLPLAMVSMQYLVGIAVVFSGCCAILSFQSVPDIIYSSMAITCISNVDEFFYEAFQEVTGLEADFRVMKRMIGDDVDTDGASARHHKTSVRPLPLAYHFCSKLGLFFPMVFAGCVFGRAWYSGHMPSERITLLTSGTFSWFAH